MYKSDSSLLNRMKGMIERCPTGTVASDFNTVGMFFTRFHCLRLSSLYWNVSFFLYLCSEPSLTKILAAIWIVICAVQSLRGVAISLIDMYRFWCRYRCRCRYLCLYLCVCSVQCALGMYCCLWTRSWVEVVLNKTGISPVGSTSELELESGLRAERESRRLTLASESELQSTELDSEPVSPVSGNCWAAGGRPAADNDHWFSIMTTGPVPARRPQTAERDAASGALPAISASTTTGSQFNSNRRLAAWQQLLLMPIADDSYIPIWTLFTGMLCTRAV